MSTLYADECAWLAGLFDGEGTLALALKKTKDGRMTPGLRAMVYSTNEDILNKVRAIYTGLGISWSESIDSRDHKTSGRLGSLHCVNIKIAIKGFLKLYPLVRPQIVKQTDRWDIAHEFWTRNWVDMTHFNNTQKRNFWSEEEIAIWIGHRLEVGIGVSA